MTRNTIQRLLDALLICLCVATAIGFAAPAIYYCAPHARQCVWSFHRHGATDDWRYFAQAWEAARVALTDFHQLPSWNPYHCGGLVLYQDPQAPFPGPLFLLTFFWLSANAAMKVWVLLHLVVGALGGRWLAKDMGANRPEQYLASALVSACGFCAWHFGGGHLSFTPFLFLPWLLFAQRRALKDARWMVLVAALLAVSFYEGATYPLPLMLVALGLDILARLGSRDERRGLYAALPVLGVLFPLLAAARLIPVLRYLGEHPRLVPLDESMTVAEVVQTWMVREHDRGFPGHIYVWNEFGDYIGLLPVLLLVCGIVVATFRRDEHTRARRIDLVIFVGTLWCALGNIPGFSLFGLLHELPIYRSLRVPARFLYPVTVAVAMLAVWALMAARRAMAERSVRAWVAWAFVAGEMALGLFVAVDLCVTNAKIIQMGVDPELPRVHAPATFVQNSATDYGRLEAFPTAGHGTRACYVPLEWGPAPGLQDGNVPQFRLADAEAGAARQTYWSPNELRFSVDLTRPATLVINQNYESSWSASEGRVGAFNVERNTTWHRTPTTVTPEVGLLAVDLPAGHHDLRVRHRPAGLTFGVLLFVLGLALSALTLRMLTPARVERIGAWLGARLLRSPAEDAAAAPREPAAPTADAPGQSATVDANDTPPGAGE